VKCLSVKQPWAWAIMAGLKDVENRSWEPYERVRGQRVKVRGRLLIHASARPDDEGRRFIASLGVQTPRDLPNGVILGSVVLADVVTNSTSPWADPGQKHWLVRDPIPWPAPIPALGKLGLWEWTPDSSALAVLAPPGPEPEPPGPVFRV
jgi:hypothetical protein